MYKVDYHIHSNFSDGKPDYKTIIDKAKDLNMDCIAITDHFDRYDPNPNINCLKEEDLLVLFENIKNYASIKNQKVLCGIETCTDFEGNLRIENKIIDECEIIITSPHYIEYDGELIPNNYYNDNFWKAYKKKVLNMAAGCGDILGHAESYLPYGKMLIPNTTTFEGRIKLAKTISEKYFDDEFIDNLITNLKKSNKAYELHCITKSPRESVIKKLIQCGVKISFGSDAHDIVPTCNTLWGEEMLLRYNGEDCQFTKGIIR